MRFFTRKRSIIGLIAVVAVAAMAFGAYAYFTNSGTGTGSATVGTSSTVAITGTTPGNLYPAGPARTVSITLHNTGAGSQYVNTVSLDSITADAGHPTCDVSLNSAGSAFTFANPVSVTTDLTADDSAPGGTDETTVTGSLQMNDTGVPQDTCQGASLTLHFSSN